MCYRPITISNPALVKNNVYNKSLLEVPCGHCPQCKDIKRLSWFVRLFYEWKFCQDNGGFGLFETFTWNNDHLPRCLTEYSLFNEGQGIPCFSIRDFQLYMKRLRKRLTEIYPNVDISSKVKYFCAMEYGGKTHRPHLHPCFFVSTPEIDAWTFKYVCESLWHENGFTQAGDLNYGFIVNAGGLSYCAKYVCKDVYEDSYLRKLDNKLKKLGFKPEEYKDIFPRTLQSKNLGIYALEFDKNNDLDNFFEGTVYLPDKDRTLKPYKLPLYYERKIFYDVHYRFFDKSNMCYVSVPRLAEVPSGVDYSPIYVLNDLGIEMKEKRAQKSLDAVSSVYRLVVSLPEYEGFIDKLNEKFNTHFKTIKQFTTKIKCELPEEIFVSYSLVYRGCKPIYKTSVSPCGSTPYYDYMLIHDMSRGSRPLSVDFDNLCHNIDYFVNLPFIEDNYQMIRYMFKLVNLELENDLIKKELEYVDQKSAYLAHRENINCLTKNLLL